VIDSLTPDQLRALAHRQRELIDRLLAEREQHLQDVAAAFRRRHNQQQVQLAELERTNNMRGTA